jgi:hypothetical protein
MEQYFYGLSSKIARLNWLRGFDMKKSSLFLAVASLFLFGCNGKKNCFEDLNSVKNDFIKTIFSSEAVEGPFFMNYQIETIFFSKNFISLFGTIDVYDGLPHGRHRYEGKTFLKTNGKFKEIFLRDLFVSPDQQEFLRAYCEKALKKNSISYFNGRTPLKQKLDLKDISTFVIDDHFLVLVFQPYVVGGGEDGPFFVKIPFEDLKGHWDSKNVLFPLLSEIIASHDFVLSEETFYRSGT